VATPIPTIPKATARRALSERSGTWWELETTSTGNVGKTTAVSASLIGQGDDAFKDKFQLLTEGTNDGEWRLITTSENDDGTTTAISAYTAQVASSVTWEMHTFPPSMLHRAINLAIMDAYPNVYRPVTGFLLAVNNQSWYGTPRNMRDILRVSVVNEGSKIITDDFDRTTSATTAGDDYNASVGTWGIVDNKLYSQSDADGDLLIRDVEIKDGLWRARVAGTLDSDTDYRSPVLVFRKDADDADTYLGVRLRNNLVQLLRVSNGTTTVLDSHAVTTSNGVDYIVQVWAVGPWIRVFVDGVELVNHQLLGTDVQYANFDQAGFRLDKAGSPGSSARWNDWRVHKAEDLIEISDFEQSADRRSFRLAKAGHTPYLTSGSLIVVEGRAPLTELPADTLAGMTYGDVGDDSTATLEIETDDPAWSLLLDYALARLYRLAAQPGSPFSPDDRAMYSGAAAGELQNAERRAGKAAMPRPRKLLGFPQ
jgi:hypothetical protein